MRLPRILRGRVASELRLLADQAFSRAAGAPLVRGNAVRVLCDAEENYPAWLTAIEAARRYVHFEMYIFRADAVGERFAQALLAKARSGVPVRLLYDWLGGLGNTPRRFWRRLREGGVDVRCYNPPRLDEPLGWLSRDHRKCIVVDGELAFVTGLCVGQAWEGDPGRRPFAVARHRGRSSAGRRWPTWPRPSPTPGSLRRAPARGGAVRGERPGGAAAPAGDVALRVVAGTPGTAGLLRLDQLVAGARPAQPLAHRRLLRGHERLRAVPACRGARTAWTCGCSSPAGAATSAIVQAISRAGYRSLLEAGVRVFEWNGR